MNQTPPDDHTEEDWLFDVLQNGPDASPNYRCLTNGKRYTREEIEDVDVNYLKRNYQHPCYLPIGTAFRITERRKSGQVRDLTFIREPETYKEWLNRKSNESPGKENNKGK